MMPMTPTTVPESVEEALREAAGINTVFSPSHVFKVYDFVLKINLLLFRTNFSNNK